MKIVNQTKFLRTLVSHFNYEKPKMLKKISLSLRLTKRNSSVRKYLANVWVLVIVNVFLDLKLYFANLFI